MERTCNQPTEWHRARPRGDTDDGGGGGDQLRTGSIKGDGPKGLRKDSDGGFGGICLGRYQQGGVSGASDRSETSVTVSQMWLGIEGVEFSGIACWNWGAVCQS